MSHLSDENAPGARECTACGSNLKTRGGADIIMRHDGTVDHAGDSRWKAGAGTAGGGLLLALAKFKGFLFVIPKLYLILALVHISSIGGMASIIGILVIVALVVGSIFGFGAGCPSRAAR